jgi:ribosome-associated translation inhibitor RaiA
MLMKSSIPSDKLVIELHTLGCTLTPEEIEKFDANLQTLARQVSAFPVSDLEINVAHQARTGGYSVKTALVLTGQTLVASADHALPHPAFERCVDTLIEQVRAYKERLGKADEQAKVSKGTHHEVVPTHPLDGQQLDQAVEAGDYAAFRSAVSPYEESLRQRVSRWVSRYPEAEARLGAGLSINDVVEAVFLDAFERYDHRPTGMRMGEWLEGLIDTSLKSILQHPDEALENIRFAQTLSDTATGQ